MIRPVLYSFLMSLLLSACMRTRMDPEAIHPDAHRLAAANNRPISVSISRDAKFDEDLGDQYLLAFPFGDVEVEKVEQAIHEAVYLELSLRGFTPQIDSNLDDASLRISVLDLDLSAYDYFITRKIACSTSLSGTLFAGDGTPLRSFQASAEKSSHKKFAFKPELQYIFDQTIESAVKKLFDGLQI